MASLAVIVLPSQISEPEDGLPDSGNMLHDPLSVSFTRQIHYQSLPMQTSRWVRILVERLQHLRCRSSQTLCFFFLTTPWISNFVGYGFEITSVALRGCFVAGILEARVAIPPRHRCSCSGQLFTLDGVCPIPLPVCGKFWREGANGVGISGD